jgi:GT2 family glycosyltransferase
MRSLTIGMATGGTVRSETVASLIGAMDVLKNNGIPVQLTLQVGGYVAHNRNRIVRAAQNFGTTHLLFLDNDMVFKPSAIQRLWDHDKDIVGANYNTRGTKSSDGRPISTIKIADEKGNLVDRGEIPNQLFECFAVATGFMMVNMSVFDKLDKPWFEAGESADGEHFTEDVEFCRRAQKAGIKVWCSPTIKVGHIGTQEF